jgi:hypothetical protein
MQGRYDKFYDLEYLIVKAVSFHAYSPFDSCNSVEGSMLRQWTHFSATKRVEIMGSRRDSYELNND